MTQHRRSSRKRRTLTRKEREMICALLRDQPESEQPEQWLLADELEDSTSIIVESRK